MATVSNSDGSRVLPFSGSSSDTGRLGLFGSGPRADPGAEGGAGERRHAFETALVWLRRDLRLEDNPALTAAIQSARTVVPVFIWSPEEEGQFQPGRCSRWWLKRSLESLDAQLAKLGSRIVHRLCDSACSALMSLVEETGAEALFFNHLYDPISLVRDHEVKRHLISHGLLCCSFNADLLYEPWEVLDARDSPFSSFQSFWDRVQAMPYKPPKPLPKPNELPPLEWPSGVDRIDSLQICSPEEDSSNAQLIFKWSPGTEGALAQLATFLEGGLVKFDADRAKIDRTSTSQLSPHIHFGEISVRHIYWTVMDAATKPGADGTPKASMASVDDYLRQMGYREYARYLSYHFPFTHERAMLEHLRACPWRYDQTLFKAWRQGMTGYPLVDAGMRELWSTGWVHNRIRVVAASFMCKNLLLPWQWGLKHFWDALLDADLENDALGWQYVSGCLVDAHPFSHMMDLEAESLRFDPDGNYVRRWLPSLARLPTEYIHRPWKAPQAVLDVAGVELGATYPLPVVTDSAARQGVAFACSIIGACMEKLAAQQPFRPASNASAGVLQALRLPGATHAVSASPPSSPEAPCPPQIEDSESEVVSNTAGADPYYGGSSPDVGPDYGSSPCVREDVDDPNPASAVVPQQSPQSARPRHGHGSSRGSDTPYRSQAPPAGTLPDYVHAHAHARTHSRGHGATRQPRSPPASLREGAEVPRAVRAGEVPRGAAEQLNADAGVHGMGGDAGGEKRPHAIAYGDAGEQDAKRARRPSCEADGEVPGA